MGKTFKELAGDDNIVDLDEFTKLCDDFAVQEGKAKAGVKQDENEEKEE